MMATCNGEGYPGHDDIVYEGNNCPLCSALKELKRLEEELIICQKDNEKMDEELSICKEHCGTCSNRIVCVTHKDTK
jgi:hypothetical protein